MYCFIMLLKFLHVHNQLPCFENEVFIEYFKDVNNSSIAHPPHMQCASLIRNQVIESTNVIDGQLYHYNICSSKRSISYPIISIHDIQVLSHAQSLFLATVSFIFNNVSNITYVFSPKFPLMWSTINIQFQHNNSIECFMNVLSYN